MDPFSTSAVRQAYDTAAADYVAAFGDDLASLPLDREMIDLALDAAPSGGWVVEVGCGPAPAATYIAGRSGPVLGVDLAAGMLAAAGARNPGLRRTQADMRRLPLREGGCALAIAYYSLQHLARPDLGPAMAELRRVLRRDGWLLVATHLGEGEAILDEFLGHRVSAFAGAFHQRDELIGLLASSGFRLEEERQRDPLPHEYDSRRIYLLAGRNH